MSTNNIPEVNICTSREYYQKKFIEVTLKEIVVNFKNTVITCLNSEITNFEFDFYGEFDQLEEIQSELKEQGITIDGIKPNSLIKCSSNKIEVECYNTFKCTYESMLPY